MINDMTKVFIKGCDGRTFQISGALDFQGVQLRSVNGLVATVSREVRGKATSRGGEVIGFLVEQMTGSLEVEILRNDHSMQTLPEVWESWKKAWSTSRPGVLRLVTRSGEWRVNVMAQASLAVPNPGPSSPGISQFTSTVDVLALDGLWSGTPHDFKNVEIFDVYNAGSVDLHPEIFWVGEGQSFTLPSGRRIVLPTVTTEHRLSLDPGTGFKVWDSDGNEATSVWAAFRGLDVRGPIPPGEIKEFRCSPTAWLRATPLHENPWG